MTFVEFHLLELVEFTALLGSFLVSLESYFADFCIESIDVICWNILGCDEVLLCMEFLLCR